MKYTRKYADDDVNFTDINNFFIDNNILCIELDIQQHQELYVDIRNRSEIVTMGDVNFITNLFDGKLKLNEKIFYKRNTDFREYDEMDDGWREEDVRKYSDWKKSNYKKSKSKRTDTEVENNHKDTNLENKSEHRKIPYT